MLHNSSQLGEIESPPMIRQALAEATHRHSCCYFGFGVACHELSFLSAEWWRGLPGIKEALKSENPTAEMHLHGLQPQRKQIIPQCYAPCRHFKRRTSLILETTL